MDLWCFSDQGMRDKNLDFFTCLSTSDYTFIIIVDGYGDSCESKINIYLQELLQDLMISHEWINISDILKRNAPKESFMSMLLAKIGDENIEICSIGDCRAYMNNVLITQDDSLAWQIISSRKSFKDVAELVANHPLRHKLTDSMRPNREKDIEALKIKISPGDKFLFCTDGVWPYFHKEICNDSFDPNSIFVKREDNSLALLVKL